MKALISDNQEQEQAGVTSIALTKLVPAGAAVQGPHRRRGYPGRWQEVLDLGALEFAPSGLGWGPGSSDSVACAAETHPPLCVSETHGPPEGSAQSVLPVHQNFG